MVDPRLQAAGWTVVPYEDGRPLASYDGCVVEEVPTDDGPRRPAGWHSVRPSCGPSQRSGWRMRSSSD